MAEIKVEPQRRSLAWLWILLLVLVIAAAVWYFVLGAPGMNANARQSVPAAGDTTGVNGTTTGSSTGATSALWRPDFMHQEA